jgi:hypothetical protein
MFAALALLAAMTLGMYVLAIGLERTLVRW